MNEYSFTVVLFIHQLSPSPNSSIYCFIVSVDCNLLLLVVNPSIVWLRTMLKSPPMMILESVKSYGCEKSVTKKGVICDT